jgi:hypothetical protein
MNHGRSCYLTWMRGAIWRAATSLPSQPEAAVGRQKYRSRLLLRMPRFASNLARPARKVKHTLACAAPPSVSSRPRVRFRSIQTSALGRLQLFRASKEPQSSAHLCPIWGSRTPEKSSGVNAFSSLRLQSEHSATFTTFLDDCSEIFVLNAEPAHCRSHIPSIGTIRI